MSDNLSWFNIIKRTPDPEESSAIFVFGRTGDHIPSGHIDHIHVAHFENGKWIEPISGEELHFDYWAFQPNGPPASCSVKRRRVSIVNTKAKINER